MATSRPALRLPAPVASWLATKSRGERLAVAALAVIAAGALLWAVLWQPLVRDSAALRITQEGNASALADARRMASEIVGLGQAPAKAPLADARAGLDRILMQHNLRAATTQLEWRDGRAHIVFAAVGYDALIPLLEAMQREARLRPVAATLTARIEPGMVRAEITLAP